MPEAVEKASIYIHVIYMLIEILAGKNCRGWGRAQQVSICYVGIETAYFILILK
jgi:hypothetical protein